ncbi:protein phosphatase 1 regulatory subunit 15A isoform X3 [Phyllostomus hastatus]|uniref:protein phosphatase 1 regulatory subunit 15A isoform X2 n=1 Tax=Phyllostomus hastatus TaxID=9423 RepID=UPI001E683544|nr:protein phosphatase 1 regulatory subunit 15A isoform X2 [Phyllostomus hastatus]XP_045712425.1 protein phosphatase 1 regulatory subunit 15A isoform X3 [Phyllostomus hastatus]
MAPRQVPHQLPWRDVHPFFLLSPLMALLSRAWSRLRGPGPPKPWLAEAVQSADQGEAALQGEAEAALATRYAPWGGHPPGVAEGSGAPVEDGESSWKACPALKANSSLLEAWEPSDDNDEEYGGEEATSGPTEHGSEYTDGQLAPPSPSLLKTLQDPPREEESEEGGVAEDTAIMFSFPPSHWESGPGMEEEEDGEAVSQEAPIMSTSPLSPGPKPRARGYCAGEAQAPAKEEERTENKETRKTSTFSSCAGSHPSAWECYSGEESEEEGEAEGPSSISPTSTFLRAWVYRPGEDTEDEEEEGEDNDSGTAEEEGGAEGPSSISPTSTFLRAWVYRPGEDTEDEEEEEEDSDSGAAEEEGEAEVSSSIPPTSTLLRAWVYRPGEDTEDEEEEGEDSDSGASEDEGEAEGPSSIPPTSTFLRAWVYRPGEDTEDEEEEEEDSNSGAAEEEGEAEGPSSISPASAFLRSWVYRPGEDSEEEDEENEKDGSEAAGSEPGSSIQAQSSFFRGPRSAPGKETEEGEAEPHPFRVAIYLPGEKPPPPWALPRLPARLQRRLKSAEAPTRHLDPETPQKTTKVRFSEKVSIHFLVVWAGPAQAARQGPWEQLARDRSRFARRIAQAEEVLGPCFTPAARAKAWARPRDPSPPPPPPAATPATTQTLPTSSVQATPLSHAVISPFPIYVAAPPCLDLSWRRS